MTNLIQIVTAFIAAVSASLIYGARGKRIFIAGVGSALTWSIYLIVFHFTANDFNSVLAATLFGSFFSAIAANLLQIPKTVFLFSVLIALIPGRYLYLTMRAVVAGDVTAFTDHGLVTLTVSFAIALGIIIMLVCMQIKNSIKQAWKR